MIIIASVYYTIP